MGRFRGNVMGYEADLNSIPVPDATDAMECTVDTSTIVTTKIAHLKMPRDVPEHEVWCW